MAKIAKIIFNVILIIIIILLVIYALLRFTNKVDIYKVETGSMETNIHPGDYIMILNTISGRTYNDLSQYFIFPWIIFIMPKFRNNFVKKMLQIDKNSELKKYQILL